MKGLPGLHMYNKSHLNTSLSHLGKKQDKNKRQEASVSGYVEKLERLGMSGGNVK